MLENRSFDHMLGFSGITGADAQNNQVRPANGLTGNESNLYDLAPYSVSRGAPWRMPFDPNHEFPDILEQLCGSGGRYTPGGQYPPIDNSGFAASYAASGAGALPAEVMCCYTSADLPVLNALASEFVLCDNWHASLPGPTWPNRMFVHAASSGGLDHSPTVAEIADWETIDGFHFRNGNIFDRLKTAGVTRCLYGGDDFPMVAALKGIALDDVRHFSLFRSDLAQPVYPYQYVFIEPSYDVLNKYKAGTSQHPLGDVTAGEALIKETYEAIRSNPAVWNKSILIVTWDEHGGFYDHAIPPAATAPGDTVPGNSYNEYGFTFEQYGVRVPAILASPLIERNLLDGRLYDHSSIPRLIELLWGMDALTARDAMSADLTKLITLAAPRDTPLTLPAPANSAEPPPDFSSPAPLVSQATVAAPLATVNEGNLPAVVHSAMQQDLVVSPDDRAAIVSRVRSIQTQAQAAQYMAEVQQKVRATKVATAGGG